MGNSQSTEQQEQMSYLAISPSPFVSIVKRPAHGLSDSMRSTSSHRNSKAAQDSVYCSTDNKVDRKVQPKVASGVEQKVASKVEPKPGQIKPVTLQGSRQPDLVPWVVCDRYSSGVSREQLRLTGSLHRENPVCCNQDSRELPRRDVQGSCGRSCTEVNISKVDINEVNSVHSKTLKFRGNCTDSLSNHHCTESNLQHNNTNVEDTDNSKHHDVNTNELNTDEMNTDKLNIDEMNTNRDDTFRHDQHYIITQNIDITDHFMNINGAKIKQNCSSSHQQHKNIVSEEKSGQCLKTDTAEEPVTSCFISQLSVTESCLEEMTEENQGSGHGCLESSKEDIVLVERGGSFDEHKHNGGDKKTAKDQHLHSHKGVSLQQIEQDDSLNGHDYRLLRGITNLVVLSESKMNIGHFSCGNKLSSRTLPISTSNDTLKINYVNENLNTASSSKHILNSAPFLYSDTSLSVASLSAKADGPDSNLQACSLSPGTDSVCENRLQTAQFYVHPRTGEFHSLVFGSFAEDGTSLPGCSRTFSQTRQYAPESEGYSINHTDMSFGTGSFTFSSQSYTDNVSSDFSLDNQFGVQAGRAVLFDSFRDSVHSRSPDHDTSRHKAKADLNAEETAQSSENQKDIGESQQIPCTESGHFGENSQHNFQTKKAVSSCESCSIATSSMEPFFGSRSGSLCHMCKNNHQSLAQDTNYFSVITNSHGKSQHSCDSWKDSLQKTGHTHGMVDYDSDCGENFTNDTQQKQLMDSCKCETVVAMKDNGNMLGGTKEIEKSEAATEQFGLGSKAKVTHTLLNFGEKCLAFCSNIIKRQNLAENSIRGMNTQGCYDNTVYSNVSPNLNKHKPLTQAGMGCNLMRRTFSEATGFVDQGTPEGRSYAKSSPGSAQFNRSTWTKSDNGRHLRRPLGLDRGSQADKFSCPHDDGSDTTISNSDSSRRNRYSNFRNKGQDFVREHHKSGDNQVRQEEMNRRPERCLLRIQHSRSLSCDCSYPFKQNYVAYLCCAPDDLSSFGLPFHEMLESWGFRIFIASRDLELTGPMYDNMARWLEERCNGKIIVILSKNYEKSDECLFLTYFARTLDPDSKYRNIIPVMIDRDVAIPNVLKGLSIIKYNYDFRCGWLKKKLVNAIAA